MSTDDYGKDVAAPTRVMIGGVDYRVAKLGPRIMGELTQFLKSFVPDPRLKAAEILRDLPAVPNEIGLRIWEDFCREAESWPPTLDSYEGNMILTTTLEGAKQVVWSLLRKHDASMTMQKAEQIAESMTHDDISRLLMACQPERTFDPNSPGAPTTTEDRGPVPATARSGPSSPSDTAGPST